MNPQVMLSVAISIAIVLAGIAYSIALVKKGVVEATDQARKATLAELEMCEKRATRFEGELTVLLARLDAMEKERKFLRALVQEGLTKMSPTDIAAAKALLAAEALSAKAIRARAVIEAPE